MIHGMTGYGRGEAQAPGVRVTADVRTVNHRYLDVEMRGAPLPAPLESRVRKVVADRLGRGKVDLLVAIESTDPDAAPLRVNRAAMHALILTLRELGTEAGVPDELSLSDIARLPWARAVEVAEQVLTVPQEGAVLDAVGGAIDATIDVRRREGLELAADFRSRLDALRVLVGRGREEAAGSAEAHVQRLRGRIAELAAGVPVDEQRLAHEVALLADRSDVAEELTRLEAYLVRLDELLAGEGPAGKKLDFTLQEAFREVNTIGSKARALELSSIVIDMKSELERMREQAANVE